jgi:hypothetical protein
VARGTGYFLLGVLAALAIPSPDAATLLLFYLGGGALFEVGLFAYRRWRARDC